MMSPILASLDPLLGRLTRALGPGAPANHLAVHALRLPLSRIRPGWPDLCIRLPRVRLRIGSIHLKLGAARPRGSAGATRSVHARRPG